VRRLARAAAALALVVSLGPASPHEAQALDPTASEALAATLRMLLDPAQRAAAIEGNSYAVPADKKIRELAGSDELTQELYALAADLFQELVQSSDGDLTKLTEALQRGQADPAAFAAGLSPRTLERRRELSVRISDQRR
jgi:hypothetical protein